MEEIGKLKEACGAGFTLSVRTAGWGVGVDLREEGMPAKSFRWFIGYIYVLRALVCWSPLE